MLSIRISCPQCGGNIKVPPYQAGQRCRCPRCGAELDISAPLVAPAETRPVVVEPTESYDDVYGVTCQICQTRLHVRPNQVGSTIKCPDCYSPVLVTTPPKRKQLPAAARAAAQQNDPSVVGPTAMQATAQKLLEKARAEQEQAEAEERERSADRFVQGLFDFLIDPQATVRILILAAWFTLATALVRWASGLQISEEAPALLSESVSLVVTLFAILLLLAFLVATAAFGWALVRDTSEGRGKIEPWPGLDPLAWDRDLRLVVSAGLLAALPGVLLGAILGWLGITGMVLYTAAATFGALFPPMLLSMWQAQSVLVPLSEEAWSSVYQRPEPWNLTYLITSVLIILGLFGIVTALLHGFPLGPAGALLATACMALYFRTIGRLFGYLGGRDR